VDIAGSFQHLLGTIQLKPAQAEVAQRHIATVKTRLEQSFQVVKTVTIGSYSRGTYIASSSDVDLFCVLKRDEVRRGNDWVSSNTTLDRVKSQLEGRFWNTHVYRDVQAVVVQFSDCRIDVVPGFYWDKDDENWPLYYMPDGEGGWMKTSPEKHNRYIAQEDDASGGKLKRTAQLLKFWRDCRERPIPVSSFHIEIVLAEGGVCRGVKSYASCLTELLQSLAQRECKAMRDPLGMCGNISCTRTEAQRLPTLASIRSSRDHAKVALAAIESRDLTEARRQWDIVFNGHFPW
jgi:hypothetical protein